MADVTDLLRRAPFDLDEAGIDWVKATKATMTTAQRVGQLFVFHSMGRDSGDPDSLAKLQPAGITRNFFADAGFEAGFVTDLQVWAKVPLFISVDLAGSRMSLSFKTAVPNPLALAALDDVQASRSIARGEARITGHFGAAMARYWHDIPTLMVSFGYPYYRYDAPRAPTSVNAYTTMVPMQQAVVECLMGRAPWNHNSPVGAFCGLPDARF